MNTLNQIALLLFSLGFLNGAFAQKGVTQKKNPIVIIDPGHGGKDDGAKTRTGIKEKDILSGVDASLDNVNTIVADVRNTQLIPTAEGALQDARTLMEGVDDASMRQLNQIVQNCGDGITMEIPKGKLAEFKIDVPLSDDVNVQVPSSDMNLKLKFPGCSENFKKEAFSKIIKDTFKTKNLPSRFEREFHIDANGHIRTGVKDKRV